MIEFLIGFTLCWFTVLLYVAHRQDEKRLVSNVKVPYAEYLRNKARASLKDSIPNVVREWKEALENMEIRAYDVDRAICLKSKTPVENQSSGEIPEAVAEPHIREWIAANPEIDFSNYKLQCRVGTKDVRTSTDYVMILDMIPQEPRWC